MNQGNTLDIGRKETFEFQDVIVCDRRAALRHCESEVTRLGYASLIQSGNLRKRTRVLWSDHAISATTRAIPGRLGRRTESTPE